MSFIWWIVIIIIGVIVINWIVSSITGEAGMSKQLKEFYEDKGFEHCRECINDIEDMVRSLGQCSNEKTFKVQIPRSTTYNDKPVYFYQKLRYLSGGDFKIFDEFMIPFDRKSDRPVIVYMTPRGLPEKFRDMLLAPIVNAADANRHDKLSKLEIPRALKEQVLAAYGPEGTKLYDLLDSSELSLVLGGAESGGFIFMANEDIASVAYMPRYPNFDIFNFWNYIRRFLDHD